MLKHKRFTRAKHKRVTRAKNETVQLSLKIIAIMTNIILESCVMILSLIVYKDHMFTDKSSDCSVPVQ